MKETSSVKGYRIGAGVLYLVLAVFQMGLQYSVVQGTGFGTAYFTWTAAVMLIAGAGVMSAWMFSAFKPLKAGARRAILVGTLLAVVFELITFNSQATLINYTLQQLLPSLAGGWIIYLFIIVRLVIMILAAFFAGSCTDKEMSSGLPDGVVIDENRFKKQSAGLPDELDNPLAMKAEEPYKANPNQP